jgi:tRNA threonylcarbamoyladenosine biosynthesis protein TsaB
MSLTLAIDTATPEVSVALGGPDGVAGELNLRPGRRHGEVLAPAIESLLRLAGARLDRVERIAVDAGPGLFTGLRVGVATAKALASALDVPVVACTSLDLLAHPHRGCGRPVASVVDARRGQVFWALYQPALGGSAMVQTTDLAVSDPEEVAASLPYASDRVLVVGDGARRYAPQMGRVPGVRLAGPEFDYPRASVLLTLAMSRPSLAADKITPTYLRGADVRIGWVQRDG